MDYTNPAYTCTRRGYSTDASTLGVPAGEHPSVRGLDPWNRPFPKALEHWFTQRVAGSDALFWRVEGVTSPTGRAVTVTVYNG